MSPLELEGFGVTIGDYVINRIKKYFNSSPTEHQKKKTLNTQINLKLKKTEKIMFLLTFVSGPSTVDGEQQPQDPSVVPRAGADHESSGSPGSQNNYSSFSSLYNMLTYGIPIRIGFLLGSAAFLFFYLKIAKIYMYIYGCYIYKKPKLRPTKLFRVIDIPQNDYNMPTARSPNRYVPYESGQREYEDIGINNIYSYKSPKYKTLIEVVLKPSEQTYDMKVTHAYYKDDSNKLTDEEWNQLKHEFIPDYLEDLSIILRIIHISKYESQNNVSQNDVYTGIDLINDKLNIDEHVDIYVEILNRKKNELYGTKHIKENTDSNIFANKNIFCSNNKPNRFVP
ncbi:hypothetical protein PFNF135_00425 [Plasmodium falciparum NF135/5.C10]|uniref:Plasmodium falciparum erythrocyte membrane protein 1 acidic terminal segment domain-containing protein n=1 Tax=Plasmodium falciparum NF135/5.C10 TaxID=1036726 RepID=W4IN58_PLAFA|nr:hypothetical protein PFNF135_00425 [Plasmodium falciparum NF135/5.C10]